MKRSHALHANDKSFATADAEALSTHFGRKNK